MSRGRHEELRAALSSLPVEPLSDVGWQRIERRLFTAGAVAVAGDGGGNAEAAHEKTRPGTRPQRRIMVGVAAAAAVAAAVLALVLWPRGQEPGTRTVAGTPSRMVTAESSSAVTVGDVALEVAARSALLVDDDRGGGVLIVLERGEIACRVAPRAGRPPVVVQAGDARIEVLGTAFSVARVGDTARVVVHEGVVTVVQRGHLARVAAGQSWSGEDAHDAAVPSAHDSAAGTSSGAHDPAAGTPPAQDDPAPGRSLDRREAPARGRASSSTPADRGDKRSTAQRDDSDEDRITDGSGAGHSPRSPAAAPGDKERYERAAALEASDPRASLAIYHALARAGGPWAANALFAQGRLELELGHHDRARRLLESYLTRYPRGANAEDARQLLGRPR
jgi:ferric-dicitrate binding protein FerR (iron transport regulator)